MNMPTLPTDSLYKFLAIAGVVAVVASIALSHMSDQIMEDYISTKVYEQQKLITEINLRTRDAWTRLSNIEERQQARAEMQAIDLDTIKGMVGILNGELARRKAAQKSDKCGLAWMFGIGIIIAVLGFVSWWFRVQQFQDQILRKEGLIAKHKPQSD